MRSATKTVNMDRLARDEKLGSVLARLMMVVNDLTLANETVEMWRETVRKKRKDRQNEALKFLIETEVAYIFEGMRIIKEIGDDPDLLRTIEACDAATRQEFDDLVAY